MFQDLYRLATELNDMSIFEWDIPNDRLNYDSQMTRLLHPENRIEFQNHVEKILTLKTQRNEPFEDFELEFRIYTRNRYFIWVKMKFRAEFVDGVAQKVSGFLQNIDFARQKEAQLKEVIERDAMTGLYIKTHAPYLVNQTISDKTKMNALLVLDLDNFKNLSMTNLDI